MDVKIKNNTLSITHRLEKDETYKISRGRKFSSIHIYKKPVEVIGFTSMCEDLKHIILIDYDNTARWLVEQEAHILQTRYDLTPFYLFTTKEQTIEQTRIGNYHLICLTKRTPFEIASMLRETHADENFKTMPIRSPFRSWVLRTSNKAKRSAPKYLGVIGDNSNLITQEVSTAHLQFLEKLYPIDKIIYPKQDGLKTLYKNIYETSA